MVTLIGVTLVLLSAALAVLAGDPQTVFVGYKDSGFAGFQSQFHSVAYVSHTRNGTFIVNNGASTTVAEISVPEETKFGPRTFYPVSFTPSMNPLKSPLPSLFSCSHLAPLLTPVLLPHSRPIPPCFFLHSLALCVYYIETPGSLTPEHGTVARGVATAPVYEGTLKARALDASVALNVHGSRVPGAAAAAQHTAPSGNLAIAGVRQWALWALDDFNTPQTSQVRLP